MSATRETLEAILSGQLDQAKNYFKAAMAAHVVDALEVKKIEVASTLLNPLAADKDDSTITTQ